ncbi:MAG TPA: TolC family protein, partial [Gemmatimonas sp.]|uniref:TolC family protein n=1 Tax=Gemmatimonas sp. TaxID=1962908 RepID=UPI002ED8A062
LLVDGTLGVEGGWEDGRVSSTTGLGLTVPLFDRGQARVGRAESELRQAIARQHALTVAMRTEVRSGYGLLAAARDRSILYRDSILPLRRRMVDETGLQYNAMAVGVFGLLQARQAEIAAGQEYVDALRDYWIARAELERAVGTRLR